MTMKKNIIIRCVSLVLITLALSTMTGCVTTNADGATTQKAPATPASEKAEIYANLAVGYMDKKQYETAKGELEKALRVDPNHSKSNYIMGLLLIQIEEYADVERFMVRAVESDARNSAAAHDFGTYLCQTGEELRSVTYFDKAVKNPFFSRPELSLMRAGECLKKAGEAAKAERYLKKALDLNPRLAPALLNLAKIKHEEESHLSARAYIERYFAITKPQPKPLLLAYQIELALNARDVAHDYKTQILEKFPSSNEAKSLRDKS